MKIGVGGIAVFAFEDSAGAVAYRTADIASLDVSLSVNLNPEEGVEIPCHARGWNIHGEH